MSDTRRQHPGYFSVTMALAIPWYLGLGIGFTFAHGKPVDAEVYQLVSTYVPLQLWGIVYLALGAALILSVTKRDIPHIYVRLVTATGLFVTTFWIISYIAALMIGKMDAITVLPAWLTLACVEWAAVIEPERVHRN